MKEWNSILYFSSWASCRDLHVSYRWRLRRRMSRATFGATVWFMASCSSVDRAGGSRQRLVLHRAHQFIERSLLWLFHVECVIFSSRETKVILLRSATRLPTRCSLPVSLQIFCQLSQLLTTRAVPTARVSVVKNRGLDSRGDKSSADIQNGFSSSVGAGSSDSMGLRGVCVNRQSSHTGAPPAATDCSTLPAPAACLTPARIQCSGRQGAAVSSACESRQGWSATCRACGIPPCEGSATRALVARREAGGVDCYAWCCVSSF